MQKIPQVLIILGPLCLPLQDALHYQCSTSTILTSETDDLVRQCNDNQIEIFERFDNILITEEGYKAVIFKESAPGYLTKAVEVLAAELV